MALAEPVFEVAQAADLGNVDGGFDEFEQAAAGESAAFAGEHMVNVFVVEAAVVEHAVEDDAFDLSAERPCRLRSTVCQPPREMSIWIGYLR